MKMKKTICIKIKQANFSLNLLLFDIAMVLGLQLVDVLVQLVTSFQVFLRGQRWENSTHGAMVVEGEM